MRTWPPGTSWYSRDSAQQIRSGSQAGTVTATVPPGRSTRAISAMARLSSGTCSRISATMTASKAPSGNGSLVASAVSATAAAGGTGLAFGAHGGEHVADRCQLAEVEVGGDDAGAAAVCLERVAARAAADVEHAVARAYTELAEIDGQHPVSPLIAFR